MERRLCKALAEGYCAIRESRALNEGLAGRILSVGALVAGTVFAGCSGSRRAPEPVTLPADAPLTQESVSRLAEQIAGSISTEMEYADEVGDTESYRAAVDIYRKLKATDGPLADMFGRRLNQTTGRQFLNANCCDDRKYDNRERDTRIQGPSYDEGSDSYVY